MGRTRSLIGAAVTLTALLVVISFFSSAGAASLSIITSPSTVTSPGTTYVSWSASGVSSCSVYTSTASDPTLRSWEDGLTGAKRPAGGIVSDTTFTLRCDQGAYTQTAVVRIAQAAPTVMLTAEPQTITSGQSTYVSWTTQ